MVVGGDGGDSGQFSDIIVVNGLLNRCKLIFFQNFVLDDDVVVVGIVDVVFMLLYFFTKKKLYVELRDNFFYFSVYDNNNWPM